MLQELIQQKIHSQGKMAFKEFMELCLYHPDFGYYSRVAPFEDYYTNADVPYFAEMIAQIFYKLWQKNFKGEYDFKIIELAAGSGKLAKKIMETIKTQMPDFYEKLNYIGIEKSSKRLKMREELRALFPEKFQFLPEFNYKENSIVGIIFSNEFFDALPVHRIFKKENQIFEIFINENLKEILLAPSKEVKDYLLWLGSEPKEGCAAEAHIESREWIKKLCKSLASGFILTIDYGFETEELYSDFRKEGTLLCHFKHQTNKNFYSRLGEQDMTCHINFSTLIKEAQHWNVKTVDFQTQSQFFIENGLEKFVKELPSIQEPRARLRASSSLKSLIHPEGMGGTFKVLLQKKEDA